MFIPHTESHLLKVAERLWIPASRTLGHEPESHVAGSWATDLLTSPVSIHRTAARPGNLGQGLCWDVI